MESKFNIRVDMNTQSTEVYIEASERRRKNNKINNLSVVKQMCKQ